MPLAPTNLKPWGGQTIVVGVDNTFTWQQDGTQAAYYIEYVRNISGATVMNTGWQGVSTASHTFPANTFTNTYEYKWRVKIRDVQGIESPFSEWAVFRAGTSAVLTIAYPANDYDQVNKLPTYQHVFNSPEGTTQYKYRYQVYTGLTWDGFDALTATQQESMTWDQLELYGGQLIWDSGDIIGNSTSIEQPPDYMIPRTYWYKVRVTITDSAGKVYTSDLRTFYILLDSIPKAPLITAQADSDNGQIIIFITNPTPDVGQVAAAYNKLYRKQPDGSWLLIQDLITNGVGYDRTFASGKTEQYAASAVGTNNIESGKSVTVSAVCTLTDYWFTRPDTGATVKLIIDPKWGRMQSERERQETWGKDEKYPTVQYSPKRCYRGSFKAAVTLPDGKTWPAYIEEIRNVLDSGVPVIFRTPFGDIFKVDVYDFQFDPDHRFDEYRHVGFNFVEISEITPDGIYTYDTPTSQGYWLIDPDTGKGVELHVDPNWGGMKSERDRYEGFGLNSEMPFVNYGSKKAYRGGFSGCVVADDVTSPAEQVRRIRTLIDGKSKKMLQFKTPSGDTFNVDIYGFSFELFDRFNNARQVSFEFVEVGEAISLSSNLYPSNTLYPSNQLYPT